MATDWVKTKTLELIAQIGQFTTALNTPGGLAASGLTVGQMTDLGNANADLSAKHTAQLAAQAAAAGAVDGTQTSGEPPFCGPFLT